MSQVLNAARKAGLRVFDALHRRYRPGDYETWKYIAPIQKAAWSRKTFEHGTWRIPPGPPLDRSKRSEPSRSLDLCSPVDAASDGPHLARCCEPDGQCREPGRPPGCRPEADGLISGHSALSCG